MKAKHYYKEYETFFSGVVSDSKVVGVTYYESYGYRFIELPKWRIDLIGPQANPVTIYQSQASFQESVPHQPKILIMGEHILIDDGQSSLEVIPKNKQQEAEQAVPSDGHKPSSRVPSDGSTTPADAH